MELRLLLVLLFSRSVLEAESLIPGLYQKIIETYDGRRTHAPVSCLSHCITTSNIFCFPNREFAWKNLIPTTVCGKALKNGGLGKMEMWKLRQINKFNNNDLEFEVLSSGALYGHTLILATGCAGTVLFTFIVLFICYRVLNCGRQIKTLLYDSEDKLCGCFSNGKRKNHRRHRMTKDSSSSSAVIQMASLSSPVKMTSSLVESASPTPRSAGHFSFNEEDLRVGHQLMGSLHKVDEAEGESQAYVTEEKTNHEGPGGELDTDALLVKHHQHQDQLQINNTKIQNQQPLMLSLRPPPEERQSQSQAQQPQEAAQATETPATAPTPASIPAPTPIPAPSPTPEPTTVLTSASASAL